MKLDCADIHRMLLAGEAAQGPHVEAHVADCAPCGELAREGGALADQLGTPAAALPLEDLTRRMSVRLDRERGVLAWLRSRPTPVRLVLALGLLALLAGLAGLLLPRPDMRHYPIARLVLVMASLACVGAAAAYAALQPLYRRALGPSDWMLALALAVGVPFVLAAMPQAHALHPASLAGSGPDFLERALRCFAFGMQVGLPAFLLIAALARSPMMAGPGYLAAGLAGVAGNLVLQLDCPITHPEHLLAGHATVALGFIAIVATSYPWLRRRAAAA